MKNTSKAWNETEHYREIGGCLAIAGIAGTAWAVIELPQSQLSALIGLALCVASLAVCLLPFLASWFRLGWFERFEERRRERLWMASSAERVAQGIKAFEENRAACVSAYDQGYSEGYEHGNRDGRGVS